ncbi:MAG: NUDIX domain-containing protein [Myxococcota bacterium]
MFEQKFENIEALGGIIKDSLVGAAGRIISDKFTLGVSGLIVNEKSMVYLQKHRFWKNQSWGMPGGFVKAGSSLQENLLREVKEESKLEIEIYKLIDIIYIGKKHLSFVFACTCENQVYELDSFEVVDAGFFHRDYLPSPLLQSHKELILQSSSCFEIPDKTK